MKNPFEQLEARLCNIESLLLDLKHQPKGANLSSQNPEKLLTRRQVCELLGITPPTLHQWTRSGAITAYKVGTRIRYKHIDVAETLKKIQRTKKG
jgi:excisionase family DNA binding protein